MGTAFTYQGSLKDGAAAAEGDFDFEFQLFDAATGPGAVGPTLSFDVNGSGSVAVSKGVFTVELDFGGASFPGAARFLEIRVRPEDPTDTSPFTTLSPRVPIRPVPYSLFAEVAEDANNALFAADAGRLDGADSTDFVLKSGATMSGALSIVGPTGGSSLAVPTGAIDASEISDEPGGASVFNSASVLVTKDDGSVTLASRSMTFPSAGFCFVAATVKVDGGPTASNLRFRLRLDGTSEHDQQFRYGSGAEVVPIVGLFAVPAGTHTVALSVEYVNTSELTNTAIFERNLNCIFLPTTY